MNNKIKLFIVVAFLSIINSLSAQTYFEPYTSNAGWQTAGGGTININNGVCRFESAPDGEENRVFKQIPFTLNDNGWKAEFMFKPYDTNFGSYAPDHIIFGLTAGPLNPTLTAGVGSPMTDQDGVFVNYIVGTSGDNNTNNWKIGIYTKNGQNLNISIPERIDIPVNKISYFTFERISAKDFKLSVYSDRSKTIHRPGSPFNILLANNENITGLNYLQHASYTGAYFTRHLTAEVDTTIINNYNTITQKRKNNWFFGDKAGISFNSGTPIFFNNSAMYTVEGCSSISDENGNFLFYTNGETVYNKNHQIMVNGDNLNGEQSATQSSIIVPKPGSNSIYYLFTIAAFASPKGMQYSVIDMALQGGMGEVIAKNTPLITPTIEQITAVLHANKKDYWIISHEWNSSKFYAYLLTSAGLSATPVISDEFIVRQSGGSAGDVAGYMKVSPKGDKIASIDRTAKAVCVYSFDNSTGKTGIRNGYVTGVEPEPPYGIEFSPDGTKLYYDYLRSNNLYQLDLSNGNFDVVGLIKHGSSCNSNTDVIAGGMQLGPDGKIYFAKACDSLGVINNPNALGIACKYVDAGVYLGGIHQSIYGLPNFPNDFGAFTPPTLVATIPPLHIICAVGDSVNLGGNPTATGDNPPFTYQWSSNPTGFSSTSDNPKVGPIVNTTYTLTVTDAVGATAVASTSVNFDRIKAHAGQDKRICPETQYPIGGTPPVTGNSGAVTFSWTSNPAGFTDNTGNPSITPTVATTYYLSVQDSVGCSAKDTVLITLYGKPNLSVTAKPDSVCPGSPTTLTASGVNTYRWYNAKNPGFPISNKNPFTTSPTVTTTYLVIGTDTSTKCKATDSVIVYTRVKPTIVVSVIKNPVCANDTAILYANGGLSYSWFSGGGPIGTGDTLRIKITKKIRVLVRGTDKFGCTNTDTVTIFRIPPPNVRVVSTRNNTDHDTICAGSSLTLNANGANTYQWYNAAYPDTVIGTGNPFAISATTTIKVLVIGKESTNGCMGVDTMFIKVNPKPNVGIAVAKDSICPGTSINLTATGASTYKWSKLPNPATVLSTKNFFVDKPTGTTTYHLEGVNQYGCIGFIERTIYVRALPIVKATVTTDSICPGDKVKFTVHGAQSYVWNKLDSATVVYSSDSSFVAQPLQPLVLQVLGTDKYGCWARDTVGVFVHPKPSAKTIFGAPYACPGLKNTLYFIKDDNNKRSKHSWFVKGGTPKSVPDADSIYITWGGLGKGMISMLETNEHGCKGDTMKFVVDITDKYTPPAPIGLTTLCALDGDSVQYVIPYPTDSASFFQWYVQGGTIYKGQGNDTVKVKWTTTGYKAGRIWFLQSNQTALASCVGISDTTYVTINPSPTANKIMGDTSVCVGDENKLYAIANLAGSTIDWTVYQGTFTGQGYAAIAVTWNNVGPQTISVTETSDKGCVGSPLTLAVTVNPLPVANDIIGPDTICPSNMDSVLYVADATDGMFYQWTVSGGKVLSGQGKDSVYIKWNENNSGSYNIGFAPLSKDSCLGLPFNKNIILDKVFPNIKYVTTRADADTIIELSWDQVLSGGKLSDYFLFKRIKGSSTYQSLGKLAGTTYTDKNVFPRQYAYEYQYSIINQCGDTIASLLQNTMLLAGNANQTNKSASLHWNAYKNWKYGLMHYEVWRKLDTEQDFKLIQTTGTDTSIVLNNGYDGFKHVYRIKAIENSTAAFSWSNETTLTFEHLLHIPTAFSPNGDGVNEYWVIRNIEAYKDASVTIYNRWGKLILEAKPYQNNWDGRLNGEDIPDGTYFYIIKLNRKSANQAPDIMGNVTIIR